MEPKSERRRRRRVEAVGASSSGLLGSPLFPFILAAAITVLAGALAMYMVLAPRDGEGWGFGSLFSRSTSGQESAEKLDQLFQQTVGLLVPVIRVSAQDHEVELSISGDIGSGFLVSRNGHVLTNYHVIESYRQAMSTERELELALRRELDEPTLIAKALVLVFIDGQQYDAELVRGVYDTEMDYALLRIDDPQKSGRFPFLKFHPNVASDRPLVNRLDRVMALGYPAASFLEFEQNSLEAYREKVRRDNATLIRDRLPGIYFEYNLTGGVVSRITQHGPRGSEVIMHDAIISNGNSGGPLVDVDGRVIGVNTWAAASGEVTLAGFGSAVSGKSIMPHISRYLD